MPDSQINCTVAHHKATQIELDIVSGNFDPTLKKYKPQRTSQKSTSGNVAGLFEKFIKEEQNTKRLYKGTLCRYEATLRHLERYFQYQLVESVSDIQAEEFRDYLRKQVAERTVKDYLTLVKAFWKWTEAKYEIKHNPWGEVLKTVKPEPKQKVKPFTATEVQAILTAFSTDRYYQWYADFVAFLINTGCRFGESAALKWKHIADDFSIWIGESVSRGVQKRTKTGKARTVILTPTVVNMLRKRKHSDCNPEDLVFPAPEGKHINDRDFLLQGILL
ncbi:MAG: site-specific integrase [Gloeocapsa sp. UFS-A4-WI-NPMV-4B04]|nr:site-specific integrase [Gloeocapsa sp. UFS-A4-WI-NPMV-4B04]